MYCINVCVKFDDYFFPNSERKKKPILMPIDKKIRCLEHTQFVFSDLLKIEICYKYLRAHSIRTYSSHAKKTVLSHLKLPNNYMCIQAKSFQ